jgi:crossover junction endodeoxyribonuclease RuvC
VIFIGIDPGLHGGVGILNTETNFVFVHDTPIMEVDGKNKYNAVAMAQLLNPYARVPNPELLNVYSKVPNALVVLESVHSMPKQGVASSFTFGEGLGLWKGIIAAYNLPLEMPSPQRWKKAILTDQGKEKDASRYKAIQLFPSMAHMLSRVKDDGRAEALLLAEYGRRLRTGENNG